MGDPGARCDERGPRLHRAERTVVAGVALPAVRPCMEHAEVGSAGVVEDLGDVLVGVRVAVLRALREEVGGLRRQRHETGRVLVGEHVPPRHRLALEAQAVAFDVPLHHDVPVDGAHLEDVRRRGPDDHLDHLGERRRAEHLDGPFEVRTRRVV
jgi:hypothetical protein